MTLTVTGLATLVLWPSLDPAPELEMTSVLVLPVVLWVWLLPVAACHAVAGRAAGGRQTSGFCVGANPTLPIRPLSRAVAEAGIVAFWLLAVRTLAFHLVEGSLAADLPGVGNPASFAQFVLSSVAGLVVVFPFLLVWLSPSASLDDYWARPALLAAVYLAFVASGKDRDGVGWLVMAAMLWLVALTTFNRSMPWRWWSRFRPGRSPVLARRPRDPLVQLRRDQWGRPARVVAPLIVVGIGVAVAGGLGVMHGEWLSIVVGCSVGLCFGLVGFRPLGSSVVMASLSGVDGYRPGDFVTAWSVLPVPRARIVRGVFWHAVVFGGGATFALLLFRGIWVGLESGGVAMGSFAADGFVKLALTPLVLAVPLGSFLTCGAIGRTVAAYLALTATLVVFVVWFIVTEELSAWQTAAGVVVLVVLGAVPGVLCLVRECRGGGGS